MEYVLRYILSTILAVAGGYVGYYLLPHEPFGVFGNVLIVAGAFGFITGIARLTGFLGNVVNAFLLTIPLYFLVYGEFPVVWLYGNFGYVVFNVTGQFAYLAVAGEVEAKSV